MNKKIIDYKIGEKDDSNYTITRIFSTGDEYVIYEIESDVLSDSFRVMINPDSKQELRYKEENYSKIKNELNCVKAILYKCSRDNSLKHLIAAAVSLVITTSEKDSEENIKESKKILLGLIERINKEYRDKFRNKLIYAFTTILLLFICTALSYSQFLNGDSESIKLSLIQFFIYNFNAALAGSFLALSLKLKKIETEPELKFYTFILYGLERCIISLVNCFVVISVIKSEFAFSFINELDNPFWSFIVISIVAGFSETFVPNLLSDIERKNNKVT